MKSRPNVNPMQQEDVRKQAELERLMTAARVHRRRGDYEQAEQTIKRALEIDESNADAREFAADILFAKGALEVAAEEYKRLFTEDKARISAEEKYARAIVQIAESKRQKELLREMLEHPSSFRVPTRQPIYAALLSLAPGLGHAYCGRVIKGVVLFVATVLSWWLFSMLAGTVDDSGLSDRVRESITLARRVNVFLTPGTLFFGCIAVFLHIYALIDAPILAGKLREREGEDHPEQSRRTAEPQ